MTLATNFLTAKWQNLIMANYVVDTKDLQAFLPNNTEFDYFEGKTYLSLVGFMFADTKVLGCKIPFHSNFEEINLRFYVKHKDKEGIWQRGVVFIKEIVPLPSIALVAQLFYNEPYITMPTQHQIQTIDDEINVSYKWKKSTDWYKIQVYAKNIAQPLALNSLDAFIAEHYWGFNIQRNGKTMAYNVQHQPWQHYPIKDFNIHGNFKSLYGTVLGNYITDSPASVILAKGSDIIVKKGKVLE